MPMYSYRTLIEPNRIQHSNSYKKAEASVDENAGRWFSSAFEAGALV